jgi:hypothetical protein
MNVGGHTGSDLRMNPLFADTIQNLAGGKRISLRMLTRQQRERKPAFIRDLDRTTYHCPHNTRHYQ